MGNRSQDAQNQSHNYYIFSHPLAGVPTEHLARYPWPDPGDPKRIAGAEQRAATYRSETDPALVFGGSLSQGFLQFAAQLEGYERFFMNLVLDPRRVEWLLDKLLELKLAFYSFALERLKGLVDIISETDDLGHQHSQWLSPDMFRKYAKPRYTHLFLSLKKKFGVKTLFHSCGSVYPFIPDIIEMGPVVRAYVEHHHYNFPAPQKFFYAGPMFRYERPQSGRFRQFHQIGAEAFGIAEPKIDAEILSMLKLLFERLGLKDLAFEINWIGCETCRPDHKKALLDFFSGRLDAFCPDCRRRYDQNPLRILDCKVDACIKLREGAPQVTNFLCAGCSEHFDALRSYAKLLSIPYTINPEMVRGLDYYTRTTFEITCRHLGAQKALAAGGRYGRLVEDFGGPPTPAIGFAISMERITSHLKESTGQEIPSPAVFIAVLGESAGGEGLVIADRLRMKGLWAELGYAGNSLKSQLRRADRLSAQYVFIIGDDEIRNGKLAWWLFRTPWDFLAWMVLLGFLVALAGHSVLRYRVARRAARRAPMAVPGATIRFGAHQVLAGAAAGILTAGGSEVLASAARTSAIDLLRLSLPPWDPGRLATLAALLVLQAAAFWAGVLVLLAATARWRLATRALAAAALWMAAFIACAWWAGRVTGSLPPQGAVAAGVAVTAAALFVRRGLGWYRHGSQALRLGFLGLAVVVPSVLLYPTLLHATDREQRHLVESQLAVQVMRYPQELQDHLP